MLYHCNTSRRHTYAAKPLPHIKYNGIHLYYKVNSSLTVTVGKMLTGAPACSGGALLLQHFFLFSFFFFFFIRYFSHLHFQCYPKSPQYPPPPTPLPTHSHFLALAFPCTGAYKVCKSNGPLIPLMAN
jgi:hypothetical protein